MKKLKLIGLGILFLATGLLPSCNEKPDLKGKLDFAVSISENDMLKSFQSDSLDENGEIIDPAPGWHLLVSVTSENGEVIMEDEIIPVYTFGSGFLSEKIELATGNYFLEKFLVINSRGNVVYAAPVSGSTKAYLVNDPLPVEFSIRPNEVSHVSPEVLETGNSNPGEFGYASFSFSVVKPIAAFVMVVDDNPLYMRPSITIPAVLSLYAPDGWNYDYKLIAGVNKILVKSGYEYFEFLIENPDYQPLTAKISTIELMKSTEDNPVIFNLYENSYNALVLQPGPDEGKDAMITDLNPGENFGDHPYFEASFLSEPELTVMRTKRSLMEFSLAGLPKSANIRKVELTLSFENIIWDSIYMDQINQDDFIMEQQLVLQQIVEAWEEYDVTWNNQPETIEANQVFIPLYDIFSSSSRTYDVTSLFVPFQEIAAPNHGMMLRFEDYRDYPGGWQFTSSDYEIPEMRPELTVYYTLP